MQALSCVFPMQLLLVHADTTYLVAGLPTSVKLQLSLFFHFRQLGATNIKYPDVINALYQLWLDLMLLLSSLSGLAFSISMCARV